MFNHSSDSSHLGEHFESRFIKIGLLYEKLEDISLICDPILAFYSSSDSSYLGEHFDSCFIKIELLYEKLKRKVIQNKKVEFETLQKIVNSRCLPMGYSTSKLPNQDNCNHCDKKLNNGEVLICDHGYHYECYAMLKYKCHYCEEYYKCEIYKKEPNIFIFKKRESEKVLVEENETNTG
ncbi:hypothetical protein Glove_48g21 [Diversispora epigaea]|uniref:RING-type domain-containing protein n=1 Tax=Diversispora epigaea TaxID=1348612 RepID=A0A397JKV5_9GLOM|nr:hypothetical protein Glove_48g21 [Diversispora epigaea]